MTRSILRYVVLVLALLTVSCADNDGDSAGVPAALSPTTTATPSSTRGNSEPVVRDLLAQMQDPPGADGRTLTLARYTIAPGAQLPAHVHPGVQMAWIESGALTYTVESGTAIVHRGGAHDAQDVTGPAVVTLEAGDAVTELGDMVHFGANDTELPIVIVASLLTESDEDLAVVVTER